MKGTAKTLSMSDMDSYGDDDNGSVDEFASGASTLGDSHHDANADDTNSSLGESEKERRLVKRSKIIVLVVMFVAACVCGGAIYYSTVESERRQFSASFNERAQQLVDESQTTAKSIFSSAENFAITITSYANDKQANWPFVTIPDYQRRTEQIAKLSSALYLWFAPIVAPELRGEWERWSIRNLEETGLTEAQAKQVKPYIHRRDFRYPNSNWTSFNDTIPPEQFYLPIWQTRPFLPPAVNWNAFDLKTVPEVVPAIEKVRAPVFSEITNLVPLNQGDWPQARLVAPIFDDFDEDSKLVGIYGVVIWWHKLLEGIIHQGTGDIIVVLSSTCNQVVSYLVEGPAVTYLGEGDFHEDLFDDQLAESRLDQLNEDDAETCSYLLRAYPTREFRDSYRTVKPILYCVGVILIFLITSFVFIGYDWIVQQRQSRVASSAERSNAIVSSLFPAQVRERLMVSQDKNITGGQKKSSLQVNSLLPSAPIGSSGPAGLEREKAALLNSKPIADLFPNTTVLFADLANFTAWSSVREPSQVFMLLEQIYGSFDQIAKRRGIFKVETIGDCYVAVSGLPKPRSDHAEVMAKFSHECRTRLRDVVRHLEVILGPDTADLSMRFGLHSGPVTAGVLRGEKSRFQLFGDTVNTASRMESTGVVNRIHLSQDTADLLIARGYGRWVKEREGHIDVKGKGSLKTYWMNIPDNRRKTKRPSGGGRACSVTSEAPSQMSDSLETPNKETHISKPIRRTVDKTNRLVDWNVEMLLRQLKKIVAKRDPTTEGAPNRITTKLNFNSSAKGTEMTVLDEVREIIALPSTTGEYRQDPVDVDLGDEVKAQLRDYVATIASLYHENPFHSFEHASHVTQSVSKLLARVVTPERIDYTDMCYRREQGEEQMHQYTYGITSDPLTHFSCIFSALIHDVDHSGLPNATLVKEGSELAEMYRNQSVAEQNSVDLAWNLLMEPIYEDLRACIYRTQDELERFRQLVVNSVMATDIVDKEMGALRKKRWETAFATNDDADMERAPESQLDDINRKATIVIEHIIQASDVSHTMQHWHVYIKWNEKLFLELYKAYASGRADKDPAEGWYQGELGFFDFYLIPLAKKLKECGVFGVASDEYLNYAIANRKEWEQKGRNIVKGGEDGRFALMRLMLSSQSWSPTTVGPAPTQAASAMNLGA